MKVFNAVNRMQQAMTFHRNRHTVIAGNVANLDTPGYKPLDLERLPAGASINADRMARTHRRHVDTTTATTGRANVIVDDNGMASADGNAVNIEREMAKIDANRVRYSTTSDLVSRRLAMLRYAATDGQG